MAQATLINSAGQKVVVDSGSQQAQQYFGQGYQLMGPSGTYQGTTTTQIPTGSTLLSGPSQLAGLTANQIYKDPNSLNIYKLPNTSSPIPSSIVTNGSPLNYPQSPPINTGAGLVSSSQAATYQVPPITSATPNLDQATNPYPLAGGDYGQEQGYQTALGGLSSAEQNLATGMQNQPSQYDIFSQALESTGANKAQSELNDLNAQLAGAVADFNVASQNAETHGIQSGTAGVFYQGESAAIQRQKAVVAGSIATRIAAAQGKYDAAERLAEQTTALKFADAQQKIDNLKYFVELNKDNVTRAEKIAISKMQVQIQDKQAALDTQKANVKEALLSGAKTRYVNRNGKFYRTMDGKEFDSEAEFFKDSGVSSFPEAYQKGLVTDINGDMLANRDLVLQMMAKYPDAGISPMDSIDIATKKLQNSQLYQKDIAQGSTSSQFTLSPGEIRYDAQGNVIASGGKAPQKIINIDGQDYVLDEQGNFVKPQVPTTPNTQAVDKAKDTLGVIDKIINNKNLKRYVGFGFEKLIPMGKELGLEPGRVAFEAEVNRLKSLLAVDNIKYLKGQGQISDAERELISRIGTSLDPNMSEKAFKEELARVQAVLKKVSNTSQLPVPPDGEINVKLKSTGEIGHIPIGEFDPNIYEKVSMNTGMRTDRHNNPTAFTTSVAKLAGLRPGVDYVAGDSFKGGVTARLLGNPVDTTIRVIDKIGFYTSSGKQRWNHTAMSKSQWNKLSYNQKKQVINKMYKSEGGSQLRQYFA